MTATPARRSRFTVPAAGLVLCLGLLAGCAGQRTPTSYTQSVENNFLSGCVSTAKQDKTIASPTDFCNCAFKAIKKDVPFGDFKRANSKLTENPGKLPESFTKAYDSCKTK